MGSEDYAYKRGQGMGNGICTQRTRKRDALLLAFCLFLLSYLFLHFQVAQFEERAKQSAQVYMNRSFNALRVGMQKGQERNETAEAMLLIEKHNLELRGKEMELELESQRGALVRESLSKREMDLERRAHDLNVLSRSLDDKEKQMMDTYGKLSHALERSLDNLADTVKVENKIGQEMGSFQMLMKDARLQEGNVNVMAVQRKYLVIGIVSVRRDGAFYLQRTIASILEQLTTNPSHPLFGRVKIICYNPIPKSHPEFTRLGNSLAEGQWKDAVQFVEHAHPADPFVGEQETEDLSYGVIPGPTARNHTMAVMELTSLMVQEKSAYYMYMEDDFTWCDHTMRVIEYVISKTDSEGYAPNFTGLRVSFGMNGIIMKAEDMNDFKEYLYRRSAFRTVDILAAQWISKKHPDSASYFGEERNYGVYKYNTMMHIGYYSSYPGRSWRSFPECFAQLKIWSLQAEEVFDESICPYDDITPCPGVKKSLDSYGYSTISSPQPLTTWGKEYPQWPDLAYVDIVAGGVGESCEEVCFKNLQQCSTSHLRYLNSCNVLKTVFPCEGGCFMSEGDDLPNYVSNPEAEEDKHPKGCLVKSQYMRYDCSGKHELTSRACPCKKRMNAYDTGTTTAKSEYSNNRFTKSFLKNRQEMYNKSSGSSDEKSSSSATSSDIETDTGSSVRDRITDEDDIDPDVIDMIAKGIAASKSTDVGDADDENTTETTVDIGNSEDENTEDNSNDSDDFDGGDSTDDDERSDDDDTEDDGATDDDPNDISSGDDGELDDITDQVSNSGGQLSDSQNESQNGSTDGDEGGREAKYEASIDTAPSSNSDAGQTTPSGHVSTRSASGEEVSEEIVLGSSNDRMGKEDSPADTKSQDDGDSAATDEMSSGEEVSSDDADNEDETAGTPETDDVWNDDDAGDSMQNADDQNESVNEDKAMENSDALQQDSGTTGTLDEGPPLKGVAIAKTSKNLRDTPSD